MESLWLNGVPMNRLLFSLLNRADESGELTVHQVEDSVLAHVGAIWHVLLSCSLLLQLLLQIRGLLLLRRRRHCGGVCVGVTINAGRTAVLANEHQRRVGRSTHANGKE